MTSAFNGWLARNHVGYRRLQSWLEADMSCAVFETVEREIDNELRARFPADAIKQAVLLHYGDDPEIEPGQLWVRVLLPGDQPEEYEHILSAFWLDHQATIEEIPRYLAETLREIRLVEFTFSDNPVTSASHSYRRHLLVGDQLAEARARERGEARVDARLGSANLEAVDTLIMAGIADDRADAIGWALARFRQQPEYEQLRECVRETGRLRAAHRPRSEADTDCAVFASIEREIDHEVRKRFPGDAVRRVVLQHYGDDPEIEPGSCSSGSSCELTGPRTTSRCQRLSNVNTKWPWRSSRATWPRTCARSGSSSSSSATAPSPKRALVLSTERK
jgi:hypothetical protein